MPIGQRKTPDKPDEYPPRKKMDEEEKKRFLSEGRRKRTGGRRRFSNCRNHPIIRLPLSLDPHLDLDALFYHRVSRTVRRDGTVRLGNALYEVDLCLRTLEVQLRFDPFKLDRIEVYYRGHAHGLAQRVDAHLNSQWPGGSSYEKRSQP